jgi:hypothetical protein
MFRLFSLFGFLPSNGKARSSIHNFKKICLHCVPAMLIGFAYRQSSLPLTLHCGSKISENPPGVTDDRGGSSLPLKNQRAALRQS